MCRILRVPRDALDSADALFPGAIAELRAALAAHTQHLSATLRALAARLPARDSSTASRDGGAPPPAAPRPHFTSSTLSGMHRPSAPPDLTHDVGVVTNGSVTGGGARDVRRASVASGGVHARNPTSTHAPWTPRLNLRIAAPPTAGPVAEAYEGGGASGTKDNGTRGMAQHELRGPAALQRSVISRATSLIVSRDFRVALVRGLDAPRWPRACHLQGTLSFDFVSFKY